MEFDKWKNYTELLNYKIVIIGRDDIDVKKYIRKYNSNNFIIIENYKSIDISSTQIRNNLNSKYLDKRVYEYILKNNLYERS